MTDFYCIFSVNCSFYNDSNHEFSNVLGWPGVRVCASSIAISDKYIYIYICNQGFNKHLNTGVSVTGYHVTLSTMCTTCHLF